MRSPSRPARWGWTTHRPRGWCWSSPAFAPSGRTRRTSSRCAPRPTSRPHRAGRFATFGLAGTAPEEERNYLVDASAILSDLLAEGWTGGQLSVKLVPEEGRPDSDDPERAIHVQQLTVYAQTP